MASMFSISSGENRPVVLLGASGRLGRMIGGLWPAGTPLVRHTTRAMPGFVVFDLTLESDQAVQAMAGAKAIICLPGVTNARARATGEVQSRNTDLALAALAAAHEAGAGRVFLASSAAVYGAQGGLLTESDQCHPVSDYGHAKLDMEQATLAQGRALGHPVTALRIGNVAGADAILGGWHDQMSIDQLPDGRTPRRSYIGPQSLTRALHDLCHADDLPEVMNLAAPGAVEMGGLLDAAGLVWRPRNAGPDVIEEVRLDTARLTSHVTLPASAGHVDTIVAEWRAWKDGTLT